MTDYDRLAAYVRAERVRRFRTVDAARAVAKISRGAWDNVEKGRPAKALTYNSIEDAFGWEFGDCERIADGAEPTYRDRNDRVDDAEEVRRSNLPDGVKARVLNILAGSSTQSG